MSDIAIRLEGISKQYHLGEKWRVQKTLRETVTEAFTAPFRRNRHSQGSQHSTAEETRQTFWALQDVSAEIRCGEVVGIIGYNGAGKSTLLKILSRITEPTAGFAEVRGRVGSLLEVGTGFHPELSGGENIFLNGAILGMHRGEIERKFDEIVAFAELERFIGTPVKHYSSGMYMRLAFAVAAHLEPDILLVDEVLAVGDARFQKKCLNKMQDVGQLGRTVLFVSHSMSAITRLCERAILLDAGRVVNDGPAPQVVSAYLSSGLGTTAAREWSDPAKAPGGEVARLCAVRVRAEDGQIRDTLDIRQPVSIEMEYDVLQPGYMLMPHFHFSTEEGVAAFSLHDVDPAWRRRRRPVGRYVSTVKIPGNLLSEGSLFVSAALITLEPKITQFRERDSIAFQMVDSLDGDSARGDWAGRMDGVVRPLLPWTTQLQSPESSSPISEQERNGAVPEYRNDTR